MKKIFKIHILTYGVILLSVLTAHYRLYLSFMLLIVVHEFGHIITGALFKWKLKEIIVLPLGMISKYDNLINTPMNEEIIVASMGVIFQLVFYCFFLRGNSMYGMCNKIIIIFNLLPIYPLDGSKILNVLLNKIFSFKISSLISIYLSFVICIISLLWSLINRDLILILIFTPLLIGLFKEYYSLPSMINRFYLERYLYHFKFPKIKYIKGLKPAKMKRACYHYFKDNNVVYSEQQILRKTFDKP